MKQSFLNSLKGLFQDQAEALVESEGLKAWSIPDGTAVALVALPDTVILWMDKDNVIDSATAGDPFEVEDNTKEE